MDSLLFRHCNLIISFCYFNKPLVPTLHGNEEEIEKFVGHLQLATEAGVYYLNFCFFFLKNL